MAITPIQPNIDNTKSHRPYNEANYIVRTDSNIKPFKPEGHLVHDRLLMMPKFFLKDFAYDMKAVKDGFQGKANDHQTGRLNDVGLKLGGISIATILAARTSNPVLRTMEYAGLGAFLASMALFPKVAIQAPSVMRHGFDTGIEYIDDQGRKKSMFQDPNYIPFDMYQGERKGEDLDIIGDRLGIPRDIQNRHDVIKEQMRKIGIQNNTLWMLTAGFATPVIAALLCNGMERVIAPAIEKARNMNYNSKISHALATTEQMNLNVNEIDNNKLSKQVEKILSNYKDKQLPKAELDNIKELMSKNLDSLAAKGIKEDLNNIFKMEMTNSFYVNDKTADEIIESIKKNLPQNNKNSLEKIFVPTKAELENILPSNKEITAEGLLEAKGKLKELFAGKMQGEAALSKEFLNGYQNRVIENISKSVQKNPSYLINDSRMKDIVDFAKIIGDFKSNDKILDKCKSFKFEHTQETVIARSYEKFEKTLLNVLDIKFKDLKQMRHSSEYTQKIVEKKLAELAKDNVKYEKAVNKLAKVMSEMEINLNGKDANESHIKDLVTAIENNYNNTAKRLDKAGKDKFKNTIDMLVKEDISTLSNSVKTREDLYNLLDGTPNKDSLKNLNSIKENAKGVGSSKNLEISRIVERYQGATNSFRRILHAFDIAKRSVPQDAYCKEVFNKGKEAVFNATSSQHMLKLNTVNNQELYRDIIRTTWKDGVEKSTSDAMAETKGIAKGDILERFQKYITRFKDIIGNNDIDFTKPEHYLNKDDLNKYRKSNKTRINKFNLVAQSPVDMLSQAAEKRYSTQKWMRIVSVIGGVTLGVTVLAQMFFGKLTNPQNLRKQVSHDTNN